MRRAWTPTAATIFVALALASASGCGGGKSSKSAHPRNSAIARCAGHECRVRVSCNGRISVLFGAAPVRVRTSKSALRTTVVADFAGSRDDAVVRC
ncbi:MAG TPA: hypothetical protein VGO80_14365 [Solirubrobacteraceae bacterium]|jgi:hypothetical protein|nr:hypothetical protein [Solirubrobacteraceae bacterium]